MAHTLTYLNVFELKHVSLDKCVSYLLVGPCDEHFVIVISLRVYSIRGTLTKNKQPKKKKEVNVYK